MESLRLAYLGAANMILAEQDGEIYGFAISLYAGNRAHLARLTVTPAVQHAGIGTRLLAAAFAQYAANGIQIVTLNTQTDQSRLAPPVHGIWLLNASARPFPCGNGGLVFPRAPSWEKATRSAQ